LLFINEISSVEDSTLSGPFNKLSVNSEIYTHSEPIGRIVGADRELIVVTSSIKSDVSHDKIEYVVKKGVVPSMF
jgi:hypothetical protein